MTPADEIESHGYKIATLSTYSTPYYYIEGPAPFGSAQHFQLIRHLRNYMRRCLAKETARTASWSSVRD